MHIRTPPLITREGRWDKYTGAEGKFESPIMGVFIGLKVKVVDETVAVEIVVR